MVKYAEYFGVSADYLLGLSKAETNDKDLQFICDYTGLSSKSVTILNESFTRTLSDFTDFLLSSRNEYFFDLCVSFEIHKERINKIIEYKNSKVNTVKKQEITFDEADTLVSEYESLKEQLEYSEFKMQRLLQNMLKSYCQKEIEADNAW